MITHTLTSDPTIGMELGRRLAVASRRPVRPSRLQSIWTRLFAKQPVKLISSHA